jgi:hypothetical protein
MNADQVLNLLEGHIRMTPQQVTIAKGHIINHFNPDTSAVILGLLSPVEAASSEKMVIHLTVDTEESIKSVAQTPRGLY